MNPKRMFLSLPSELGLQVCADAQLAPQVLESKLWSLQLCINALNHWTISSAPKGHAWGLQTTHV